MSEAPAPPPLAARKPLLFADARQHLADAGETYWQHLYFCCRTTYSLLKTAVALMLHGIYPGCHKVTASSRIIFMAGKMRGRRPDLEPHD